MTFVAALNCFHARTGATNVDVVIHGVPTHYIAMKLHIWLKLRRLENKLYVTEKSNGFQNQMTFNAMNKLFKDCVHASLWIFHYEL